jgi:hypothetical protein
MDIMLLINKGFRNKRKSCYSTLYGSPNKLTCQKIIKSSTFEPMIKTLLKVINHFQNSNLALTKLRELSQNPNLTPQYPCITRWATFSKAAKTILSLRDNIRVSIIIIYFYKMTFSNFLIFFFN